MAKWLRTLDIKAEWEAASREDFKELAAVIAKKLAKVPKFTGEEAANADWINDEKYTIAVGFDWIADEETDSDVEEFDSLMEALYDWGDTLVDEKWPTTKVCWIKTSF